jgi:catalase
MLDQFVSEINTLVAAGAQVHVIAPRLGLMKSIHGVAIEATGTLENSVPVLFDGLVLPVGAEGVEALGARVEVMDFISNQYRHGKTILALGVSKGLLEKGMISMTLVNGDADPGLVLGLADKADHAAAQFIAALGQHRHPERERNIKS